MSSTMKFISGSLNMSSALSVKSASTAPGLADVAHADAFYLDVLGAYALQNVIETAAHGSETEESDVEFFTVHGVVCFPICGS